MTATPVADKLGHSLALIKAVIGLQWVLGYRCCRSTSWGREGLEPAFSGFDDTYEERPDRKSENYSYPQPKPNRNDKLRINRSYFLTINRFINHLD